MQSISTVVRDLYYKVAQWDKKWLDAWEACPKKERNLLKKYAKMFLDNIAKEPFPEKDKKILKKHVKSFVRFLDKVQ